MFKWFLRFQFAFVLKDLIIQSKDIAIYLNVLCLETFATTLIDKSLPWNPSYGDISSPEYATQQAIYYDALQASLTGVGTVGKDSIRFS